MYETRKLYNILVICVFVTLMTIGIYIGAKYIEQTEHDNNAVGVVNTDKVKVYLEKDDNREENNKEDEDKDKDKDFTVTYVDVYSECGHRKERIETYINKDKEEIKKLNEEKGKYILVSDDDEFLIFEKICDTMCNEHYKLKIQDNKVVVYKANDTSQYELYQTLEIDITTIREDILESLRNTVILDSLDELFVFLEDIES